MTGPLAGGLRLMGAPDHPRVPPLAVSVVASSTGWGLFLAGGIILLVKIDGFTAVEAGAIFSAANMTSFGLAFFLGRGIDRMGVLRAVVATGLLSAGVFVMLPTDAPAAVVVALVVLAVVLSRIERIALGALVAEMFDSTLRVRVAALFRSATNVGFALGSGLAVVAIQIGSRAAFIAVFFVVAVLQLVVVWVRRTMPVSQLSSAADRDVRGSTFLDIRYSVMALWFGLVNIHGVLFSVLIPIWVATRTDAPDAVAGGLFALNAILVVVLQARVAADVEGRVEAVRATRRSAVLSLVAAGCFLLAGQALGLLVATVLLLAAATILTLAELEGASGGWWFRFELAREGRQGEYGALYGLGEMAVGWVAPLLLVAALEASGTATWAGLAVGFALILAFSSSVLTWASSPRSVSSTDAGRS